MVSQMIDINKKQLYYQALLERNPQYEGLFYVGVKTTGVFCHSTCPARKPKFENCEFFETAKEAILASYRPCQRCQPLSHPKQVTPVIRKLLDAVDLEPHKRWTDQNFNNLGIDTSTARRQFKKRFGMTFVEYARAKRIGLAMEHIRAGNLIIDAQLNAAYESGSGFRDAFSRIMGAAPTRLDGLVLKATWLDTQLGPMICIADGDGLYLLEFVDRRGLEREVERLRKRLKAAIIPGETVITKQIRTELDAYFNGESFIFKTPIHLVGSEFQKKVWHALKKISPGTTVSYLQIATAINCPSACRAVAQANGANQLALIIPCHRVINSDGGLGGYGGGISRKQWLINHENRRHQDVRDQGVKS